VTIATSYRQTLISSGCSLGTLTVMPDLAKSKNCGANELLGVFLRWDGVADSDPNDYSIYIDELWPITSISFWRVFENLPIMAAATRLLALSCRNCWRAIG